MATESMSYDERVFFYGDELPEDEERLQTAATETYAYDPDKPTT